MKKTLIHTLGGILCAVLASCSDLEQMNLDPNQTSEVPSHMLMSGSEKRIMDNIYRLGFSDRQCLQFSQQWSQRDYTEESRYRIREYDNNYNYCNLYNGLSNFEEVIRLNKGANALKNAQYGANCNQIAAAKIMQVWTMCIMTDTWGGIPYSEALQIESGNIYPKYDSQKDIYKSMIQNLTEAVEMIDEDEIAFVSGDRIFDGDASKWKKFGNSLKCRLAIHLSKVDSNWKSYIEEAIASGVMESNEDAAYFSYSASGTDYCEFYSAFFEDERNDFTISKVLVDLMKGQKDELNNKSHPWEGVVDPRLPIYTSSNNGEYNGCPIATPTGIQAHACIQSGCPNWYKNPPYVLAKDYKTPLMTYAELKFILCEYKDFDVTEYKEGVMSSIRAWYENAGVEIEDATINDYVDAVSKTVNAETCAIQKYIDLFTNGTEAWTEIRRTGYPEQIIRPGEYTCELTSKDEDDNEITIKYKFEPLGDTKGDIISRVKYPTNESTLNGPNWQEAVSKLTDGTNNYYTKMFWDVRTSTYDHPANK